MTSKTRRRVLQGTAVAGLASLTGCQALLGGGQGQSEIDASGTAQQVGGVPEEPVTLAFIDFYSGAGSVYGEATKNATQLLIDDINANGGLVGKRPIEPQWIDEAADQSQLQEQLRSLSTGDGAHAVIGITSSGTVEALAPMAADLNQLLITHIAGSHKTRDDLFVENDPTFVFRTGPLTTVDGLAPAYYLHEERPDLTSIAGLNQDYSWGRFTFEWFKRGLQSLNPDIEVVSERFPPTFSGQLSSHIDALLDADPEAIYCSMWGTDLTNFLTKGMSKGLFDGREVILPIGDLAIQNVEMPDGAIIGGSGRAQFNYLRDERSTVDDFVSAYVEAYGSPPAYPAWHAHDALAFYVRAVDKYVALTGQWPSQEQMALSLEGTAIEAPWGAVSMPHHEAKRPCFVGRATSTPAYEYKTVTEAKTYPAVRLNPPAGVLTEDWIDDLDTSFL